MQSVDDTLVEMSRHYSTRPASAEFHRVRTERQAHLLEDPDTSSFFTPFLAREETVAGAARALGCKVNAMHYRVRTLLGAGLLKVVRETKRAGLPVKVYRSVADAFFIPFELSRHADPEARMTERYGSILEQIAKSTMRRERRRGRVGQYLFRDVTGDVVSFGGVELPNSDDVLLNVDDPDRPIGADRMGNVFLTEAEAGNLQGELDSLFRRYLNLAHEDAEAPRAEYLFLYAFSSS